MAGGWNLGVKVAFGVKDPHLSQLGADDLDPLLHDLPGVGGETDGHRLKVDHKGPFVVGRDEAGGTPSLVTNPIITCWVLLVSSTVPEMSCLLIFPFRFGCTF